MSEQMDKFRDFVSRYPLIKFEVRDKNRTWQNVFEEWSLYGEEGFKDFVEKSSKEKTVEGQETIRSIVNYVKKINPDNITKTLNNAQKVMSLLQGFQGKGSAVSKVTGDPLFDKRFDDWF